MKKLFVSFVALAVLAVAFPAQAARQEIIGFDSQEITSVAISAPARTTLDTRGSFDTRNVSDCTFLVNNKDGNSTRTLNVYCMDPTGATTVYEYDTVTVAATDYARVVFDPANAYTGSDTTKFQTAPCPQRMKATLSSLSGKKARMTLSCH